MCPKVHTNMFWKAREEDFLHRMKVINCQKGRGPRSAFAQHQDAGEQETMMARIGP